MYARCFDGFGFLHAADSTGERAAAVLLTGGFAGDGALPKAVAFRRGRDGFCPFLTADGTAENLGSGFSAESFAGNRSLDPTDARQGRESLSSGSRRSYR